MLEKLNKLVEDVSGLNSKLILLVGAPQSGKSKLLRNLALGRDMEVLNVGITLGQRLLSIPSARRHLEANSLMNDLGAAYSSNEILLLDNIELLFDRSLKLNPLELLKRHAHARRVIAVWPGELRERRLSYAVTGHPEHQDYGIDGLVPFEIR